MKQELTDAQARLYSVFKDVLDTDVDISLMYVTVWWAPARTTDTRHMQQKLAPLLHRLNRKIAPHKIVPGRLKRTYRLNTKASV